MASDDLRARIDAAIRSNMLFGLQDAELYDEPGRERINEWADHISTWAADAVQPDLDRLTAALGMLTARSDRCPQCRCGDCNGLLAQHTDTACGCDECVAYPDCACQVFALPERITLIAQQLGLLLSTHLGPRHQQRCLAVAHAAHHALHYYDYPEEPQS